MRKYGNWQRRFRSSSLVLSPVSCDFIHLNAYCLPSRRKPVTIKKSIESKLQELIFLSVNQKEKHNSNDEITVSAQHIWNSFEILIKISFISLWWRMILKKMKSSEYLIRANGENYTHSHNHCTKKTSDGACMQRKSPWNSYMRRIYMYNKCNVNWMFVSYHC